MCNVPGETALLVERGGLGVNCESDTPRGVAGGIERMAGLSRREREVMGQKARELFMRDFDMAPLVAQHERFMDALLR